MTKNPASPGAKRSATLRSRPRFPEVIVTRGTGDERQFNLADVADEIGAALTDLLLSREEKNIFNEENRAFVANVAHSVATRLLDHIREGHGLKLSEYDLSLLIEKALIENDAHDVAKSLVFKRSVKGFRAVPRDCERSRRPRRPSPCA